MADAVKFFYQFEKISLDLFETKRYKDKDRN